jgi:hypothetical protein
MELYPSSGYGFAREQIVVLQTKAAFTDDEIRKLSKQPFTLSSNQRAYFSSGVSTGPHMVEFLAEGPKNVVELFTECCDTKRPSRFAGRTKFAYQTPDNVKDLLHRLQTCQHLAGGGLIVVEHPDREKGCPTKYVLIQVWR